MTHAVNRIVGCLAGLGMLKKESIYCCLSGGPSSTYTGSVVFFSSNQFLELPPRGKAAAAP